MIIRDSYNKEKGTALVFSLMILVIMTILGVAAMSNTLMQERMAGNVNVQSIAFEAASAGVSEALDFGMQEWSKRGCSRDCGEKNCGWNWDDDTTDPAKTDPVTLDLNTDAAQQLTIEYTLRADCLEDPGFSKELEEDDYVPPVQMYVTSQGTVRAGTEEVAMREIEVRIDNFRTDGRSAIRIEGEPTIIFNAASANRFSVDGKGGPAISASSQENARIIATDIGPDRLGNYKGGVARSDYDEPFNSAWKMTRFALEIKAFMEFHGHGETAELATACNSVSEFQSQGLADNLGEPYDPTMTFIDNRGGSPYSLNGGGVLNGIIYATGDLKSGGNATGTGLVIAEGDIRWHGGADFQGTIIALGGFFSFDGAGNGETDGTIYASNIDLASMDPVYEALRDAWMADPTMTWDNVLAEMDAWGRPDQNDPEPLGPTEYKVLDDQAGFEADAFGPTTLHLDGGGNHTINYDCKKVDDFRLILSNCGEVAIAAGENASALDDSEPLRNGFDYDGLADGWANQLCNVPGRGGLIQAVRSWRENLGWRELLTDGS